MPEIIRPPNSAHVIKALELHLEEAKRGKTSFLALVAYHRGGAKDNITNFWGGDLSLIEPSRDAVAAMLEYLDAAILNQTPPPRDETLDASYVCFNAVKGGMSFDSIPWLIDAEMTRVRLGGEAPLKVGFWMGRDGKMAMEPVGRRAWMDNVIRPALALIGAVEDDRAVDGRYKHFYSTRDICVGANNGEPVPLLRAPWSAKDKLGGAKGYVTITLREAESWPHRNSNMEAWLRFGEYLQGRGERVIFVRDTAKATEPLEEFQDCPQASFDLLFRAALYESAKANLFVSNGPWSLQVFGDRPWLSFVAMGDDDHPYKPNTPSFWRKVAGVEPGAQYPWSRPDQRIIWESDTYENIVAAWEGLTG